MSISIHWVSLMLTLGDFEQSVYGGGLFFEYQSQGDPIACQRFI